MRRVTALPVPAVPYRHPDNEQLQRLRDEDRIVVSEPLADLPGMWDEIPEASVLVIQPGPDDQRTFRPRVGRGTTLRA